MAADLGGDIPEVFLVPPGKDKGADAGPVGGQDLLPNTPDGEHPTTKGYLPGEGHLSSYRAVGQGGEEGGGHGNPCRGALLGCGGGGAMGGGIGLLELLGGQT